VSYADPAGRRLGRGRGARGRGGRGAALAGGALVDGRRARGLETVWDAAKSTMPLFSCVSRHCSMCELSRELSVTTKP
jgi:hypothetical protein